MSVYVCRGWREGRESCEGRAGVPMAEMDGAVIHSLRRTFSTESFEVHLRQVADDVEARAQRRAEREHLLAEIPKLAAAETRLAKAIARIEPLAAHPLGLSPHPISGGSDATLPTGEPTVCDSSGPRTLGSRLDPLTTTFYGSVQRRRAVQSLPSSRR